ncbi:protein-(glutamine-N5) methyltransferase, release factor-specific [Candidatus Pantoea edessiphila]|uniref:Release factor glutamine methyltransferase n=1 Tax=Candidatus Pantoea edessiphila TaxID=2044610 RepID=A0A2P5T0K2_9GAMM|nr:peptide chain release factor N(5)-glutamine methyltransferase [Candidatus Pantoea edessiphila]PPI88124.1 protein-(glutamine-N5) methyltransferase, release factor-specific [Candidatus Pantoea edessiphila]
MNIRNWLQKAIITLHHSDSPKLDAQTILSFAMGKSIAWLYAFDEIIINDDKLIFLDELLIRRFNGEPLAYVIGQCEFWSLTLKVICDTMIPRYDTEIIVEQSLNYLSKPSLKILDLGTGTGAIALSIASERPQCKVFGIDCISTVVKNAQYNAVNLNISNATFFLSYWFNNIPQNKFDLIVSNPPYIEVNSPYLKLGDVRFEPTSALVSDENGLSDLKAIIKNSFHWLTYDGWLLLEHGWKQGKAVRNIMQQYGYRKISTIKDYGGNPRVTLGKAPT